MEGSKKIGEKTESRVSFLCLLAKGHAGNFVTREERKKGAFSMGVEGNRGDKLLSKQRQLK